MDSYQGSRSYSQGRYSGQSARNAGRSNYRRMNGTNYQNMSSRTAYQTEADCPCNQVRRDMTNQVHREMVQEARHQMHQEMKQEARHQAHQEMKQQIREETMKQARQEAAAEVRDAVRNYINQAMDSDCEICDNGASQSDSACSITYTQDMLYTMPLAMAYIPWQHFHETYEPCEALEIGTIFPELNKPFVIGRCASCR